MFVAARGPCWLLVRLGSQTGRIVYERTLELEVTGETAAALEGQVEVRQTHDRFRELVGLVVRSVGKRLLGRVRMHFQLGRGLAWTDSFSREHLARSHATDVVREQRDEPR